MEDAIDSAVNKLLCALHAPKLAREPAVCDSEYIQELVQSGTASRENIELLTYKACAYALKQRELERAWSLLALIEGLFATGYYVEQLAVLVARLSEEYSEQTVIQKEFTVSEESSHITLQKSFGRIRSSARSR